jgi:hypothetical protein
MEMRIKSWKSLLAGVICVAVASILLFAAPADSIGVRKARELIQNIGGANLGKDKVQIKEIAPGMSGDEAVVEARIETAFRMTRENGDWRIAEVRLGDRQWESFELIEEAVRREKVRRTTVILKALADGLAAYQRDQGRFAETDEIAELLDYLSPRYLTRPFRFDLWGKQFEYRGKATSYRLFSAGPDRKSGTRDDLIVENGVISSTTD